MPDDTPNSPEESAAAKAAADALAAGLGAVKSPADARRTLDELERRAGDASEGDIAAQQADEPSPAHQATDIAAASHSATEAITATATQAAREEPGDEPVVDQAVERAAAHSAETDENPAPPETQAGRRLLREELIHRLQPADAADAWLFILINHLPHPRWMDSAMARLTWIMTGGHGWIVVLAGLAVVQPRQTRNTVLTILPPLWLATATVEYGIKRFFRRRRPFISIMRAIVVGRKPGSYSFPSGHSAAAFAGATLLALAFPKAAKSFYALAALTAFSRVYLGAHYPGDVLSGSLTGFTLARLYRATLLRFRPKLRS